MRKVLFVVLALTCFASFVSAIDTEPVITDQFHAMFLNADCEATKSCSLLVVHYTVQEYTVSVEGETHYGTRLYAAYQTDSVKALEHYVFVQFVRGSVYETNIITGEQTLASFLHPHFSELVLYDHPDWVIDTNNPDPSYCSLKNESRWFICRWNKKGFSFAHETEELYGYHKPPSATLYMVDHSPSAFIMHGTARNVALDFATCIYRAKDVPRKLKPKDGMKERELITARPVTCFNWISRYQYDPQTKSFR